MSLLSKRFWYLSYLLWDICHGYAKPPSMSIVPWYYLGFVVAAVVAVESHKTSQFRLCHSFRSSFSLSAESAWLCSLSSNSEFRHGVRFFRVLLSTVHIFDLVRNKHRGGVYITFICCFREPSLLILSIICLFSLAVIAVFTL